MRVDSGMCGTMTKLHTFCEQLHDGGPQVRGNTITRENKVIRIEDLV
jgi:hypothetical protein